MKLTHLRPRLELLKTPLQSNSSAHGWKRNDLTPKRGLSGQQRKRRNDAIKLRCGYRCQKCGALRQPEDLVIDHRIPLSEGGSEDDSNLQPLCAGIGECHDMKTRAESASHSGRAG